MVSRPLIALWCLALLIGVQPGGAAQGSPAADSLRHARQLANKGELIPQILKVLAHGPESAAALLILGGVLETRGDLAGAAAYERAIAADPQSVHRM
jgi:hypothetical protein